MPDDEYVFIPGSHGALPFVLPPEMIDDLKRVSEISADEIERFSAALQEEPGFLSPDRLAELVSRFFVNEDRASAAKRALNNLRTQRLRTVLAMLRAWSASDPGNANRFPAAAIDALESNLRALIRDYPSLSRTRKARWLSTATGNEFLDCEIICDARPVFNDARDDVEGLVPVLTLKLEYQRQNTTTDVFEVVMTEEELEALMTDGKKALQKLQVLRTSIDGWIEFS